MGAGRANLNACSGAFLATGPPQLAEYLCSNSKSNGQQGILFDAPERKIS